MSSSKKEPSVSVEVKQDIRKFSVFTYDFYKEIYEKNLVCYSNSFTAHPNIGKHENLAKTIELLQNSFGIKRYESGPGKDYKEEIWSNTLGLFKLLKQEVSTEKEINKDETWILDFSTSDKKLFDTVNEQLSYLNDYVPETSSQVFMIHKSPQGYYLRELGTPVLDFKEHNYMPEIVEAYKDIRERIVSKNPFGRLAIIEGPPGTGKTSFIRSLITGNHEAVFVIFPVNLLHELDSSSFITFLAEQNSVYGKPIVLILEDADSCLLPREEGNMSFIATLLNSADGIIGSCIDSRIIATTNAQFNKIDAAIVRPGRLLRHVSIGKLSKERATEGLQRLSGDDKLIAEGEMSLAEVYEKVHKVSNFRPVEVKKKKIGFGS